MLLFDKEHQFEEGVFQNGLFIISVQLGQSMHFLIIILYILLID